MSRFDTGSVILEEVLIQKNKWYVIGFMGTRKISQLGVAIGTVRHRWNDNISTNLPYNQYRPQKM
jgi:hypothetical protein